MSDAPPFEPPAITDEDIRWASGLLDLPDDAFFGKDGTDPRQDILKKSGTIEVAACPGSGKTTLLVAKLAILAKKWPHRTRGICVLSHTNAARREIEKLLVNKAAGQRLLAYPHFIGTIHRFVNEFLAIPWLRSRGYQITIIDTEICESRRWQHLHRDSRSALEKRRMDESSVRIVDTSFNFTKKSGKLKFADHTETYKNVQRACQETAKEGYHCYDDMFIWARDLIDTVPAVVVVLRDRFPLLYIDEAQDNSEEQSVILHDVFMAGDKPVKRQRFGDPNQAIFSFVGARGATKHKFPDGKFEELPSSHRFGEHIAQLAGPLGVTQYDGGLKGHGPSTRRLSRHHEGRHTIFLFDDDDAGKVLDAYAALLIETFSEPELVKGPFVAVGQVHKVKGDDQKPRHVGHYWPDYDPELSKPEPRPPCFVQYVSAGQEKAEEVGEAYPAVEKIAEGVLRLAGMAEGGTTLRPRRHCHRYVLQRLEENADVHECYKDLINEFALPLKVLTRETWDNRWCGLVRQVAESTARAPLPREEADAFLKWKDKPDANGAPSTIPKRRDNIYRYSNDQGEVAIRVGSIHSVKGETHTATLVLETFWNDHNLESIRDWLTGDREGPLKRVDRGRDKPQQHFDFSNCRRWAPAPPRSEEETRLKLHYVAMTRPTHLLCLAMKRRTFENGEGESDQSLIERLKSHGWRVEMI